MGRFLMTRRIVRKAIGPSSPDRAGDPQPLPRSTRLAAMSRPRDASRDGHSDLTLTAPGAVEPQPVDAGADNEWRLMT